MCMKIVSTQLSEYHFGLQGHLAYLARNSQLLTYLLELKSSVQPCPDHAYNMKSKITAFFVDELING